MWDNYDLSIGEGTFYRGQKLKKDMNVREGFGHIKYPDGKTYKGMTKNELYNGVGRLTFPNGDIVQGNWKDGMLDGKACKVRPSLGHRIDAQFKDDKPHGIGIEQMEFGKIKYEGEFVDGRPEGKGKFENAAEVYEGQFINGQY